MLPDGPHWALGTKIIRAKVAVRVKANEDNIATRLKKGERGERELALFKLIIATPVKISNFLVQCVNQLCSCAKY
jgi:hypothetical protein